MLLVILLVTLLYMLMFPGHITGCIFLFAVKADEDLSKYVLECSRLSHTLWKHRFPQDTEDEAAVGISSEDEANSMPLVDHQARRAVRPTPAAPTPPAAAVGSAATMSTAATASTGTSTDAPQGPTPDEVVVKKSALLTMKRQVAALIRGEELPAGGAGVRGTLEVSYQVPTIGREDTRCPICHLSFKTPYHLRWHMDVHQGEQFPCRNCDKMLVMRCMLRDHEKGCISGTKYQFSQCNKEYSTKQGRCQHERAKHGPDAPAPDELFVCPHCGKQFNIKKVNAGARHNMQWESQQERTIPLLGGRL